MLIEDVRNGVMPYSRTSKWPLKARVEPADSDTEDLIEQAISSRDYRSRLYEAVTEFVHDCAALMMAYGKAIYEIAYLLDSENKPAAFVLLHFLPSSVKVEGKRLMQYIPESVRRELELPTEAIELTPENIITFELPTYMRDDYESMMTALYVPGEVASMPDFVLPSMKGEIAPVPFDVNKFSRDQKMAVAEATKLIGWNARQIADDEFITEYYWLHRHLLFERFKVEVRTSILSTLNEAITRAGKKLGFAGQIIVEGLPILTDVQDIQEALAGGNKKFGDVIKPFLVYSQVR
jgi:hypothetical protein